MTNQVAPPFQMEIGEPKSSQLPVSLPLALASLPPDAPTSTVESLQVVIESAKPVRGLDLLQRYTSIQPAPIHLWQTNAAMIWIPT